ncbi:ADP-glyceromanno-heptose 6-epimerase [Planctomycetota bacterium]
MIIVTGGAGFIGSALIASLNKRNIFDILVVDQLDSDQKWKNLLNLSFTDYIEKGDFLEIIIEDGLDNPVDVIFHLGACSDTTETNASYLIKNNYEYTKLLAQWATEADIRFIYASSGATYGDGSLGFEDKEDEIGSLKPLNMYGYSKHLFDLWARNSGLLNRIVGLKYFNVFGPNEYHKANMRSFCIKAFEQIKNTGKVKLFKSHKTEFKDGEQLRDFIYVKDAVDMTLFFWDNPNLNGLFNIGTGEPRSWNDLVNSVFAAMQAKTDIEYIQMPESLRNQYQYYTCADITKLRNAGYSQDLTSLEDAIKEYVQVFLKTNTYLTGAR